MNGDAIAVSGTVSQLMPNAMFRVDLDNGHQVLAHVAGSVRLRYVRSAPGDKVTVELSPFDLSRGRITFLMLFFFSSRRRHTRYIGDWSSDVCSSDLLRCYSAFGD